MTEREITDELMRMAEQYKAEEDRRRVRMVAQPQAAGNAQAIPETPQSGPDLNEYAYVGAPTPPVTGYEAQFRPQFSTRPTTSSYAPIKLPVGRDVGLEDIPPNFGISDSGIVDPTGTPARLRSPSYSEMMAHLGSQLLPVAGGTMPAAVRAATGAAIAGDKAAGFFTGAGPMMPGTWRHQISENKLRRPLEEMSATKVPTTELAPRKVVTPSELQGETFTPLVGDRSAAGSRLTAVNEQPLTHGVELQGGPDYMRANDALWASQRGAANSFQGRVNKLADETGQAPLAAYTAMSGTGGDYAHMTADTLLGILPSSKITQKNMAGFKTAMRDRGYPIVGVEPGKREALREQLLGPESGRLREAFVQEMARRPWQDAGFPDVGSARFATTDPAILHDPSLSGGYMIGRTAPGQPTGANPSQHMTYSTQIPGKAIGGFEAALPKETMWLDWYRDRVAQGKDLNPSTTDYAFRLQQPSQKATQKWVDQAEEFLRRRREQAR